MKVRGDDTLEGAHSLSHFLRQISSFSCHFLETFTETGSIHWVGVETWLQSSHEGKLRFHENPLFEIQLINRCSSALINKFCMFWCIYVAFEHVLLPNLVEKGAFTSQNS